MTASTAQGHEIPMSFIQLIECETTRIDEFNATLDAWLEMTWGRRAATRRVRDQGSRWR